jgi:hypothetical protein
VRIRGFEVLMVLWTSVESLHVFVTLEQTREEFPALWDLFVRFLLFTCNIL